MAKTETKQTVKLAPNRKLPVQNKRHVSKDMSNRNNPADKVMDGQETACLTSKNVALPGQTGINARDMSNAAHVPGNKDNGCTQVAPEARALRYMVDPTGCMERILGGLFTQNDVISPGAIPGMMRCLFSLACNTGFNAASASIQSGA